MTIYRQAAIEGIDALSEESIAWLESAINVIAALPSAQPESCDGCKWEYAFGYGECHRCKRNFYDMYEVREDEQYNIQTGGD